MFFKNSRKNCGFFFTYVVFVTWQINIITFLCDFHKKI